jgi:hypothetical protein
MPDRNPTETLVHILQNLKAWGKKREGGGVEVRFKMPVILPSPKILYVGTHTTGKRKEMCSTFRPRKNCNVGPKIKLQMVHALPLGYVVPSSSK